MRRSGFFIAAVIFMLPVICAAQDNLYKVEKIIKAGGTGGYDYVYADSDGRKLYAARTGKENRLMVFDLDTLKLLAEISNINAHGVAVSAKSGHGFASSKPVAMWDTKTLGLLKTIEVEGNPDGILYDGFNDRVYIFSHKIPNATVINASSGSVIGTIDLGGAPEQAVTDGKGHVYVDIEDRNNIAVIDACNLTVISHYNLAGRGGKCAGLAIDPKNQILFAACRDPQTMVILSAVNGKIISALPIGKNSDGAVFNPDTMEAFSSQSDGTLTIVKENNPAGFIIEQNLLTMPNAKTLTLDAKTGRIFLIAAEFSPLPAVQEKGKHPQHGPMVPDSFSIIEVSK